MQDILQESSIRTLNDYLKFCQEDFVIEFWVGGYLRPFHLSKSEYQWVLFRHDLCPGSYRLCLMLASDWSIRPIRAYGMAFAPGEKIRAHIDPATFGYGFNITPATAVGKTFYSDRNTTDFRTRFNGLHQVGVTTPYWSEDVSSTCFELLLLRRKTVQFVDNNLPKRV